MTDTLLDLDTQEKLGQQDGDHDRFSHYAPKEKVAESYVMGTPVVALCGKKWVPSRDPEKYPVCPRCRDIMEKLFSS